MKKAVSTIKKPNYKRVQESQDMRNQALHVDYSSNLVG